MASQTLRRALFSFLFIGIVPPHALAHVPDTYGFGSRGVAMGGAVAADATDFSASYYNPAGLASASGLSFSLGYTRANNALEMDDVDNGVAPGRGLVGGLVVRGTLLKRGKPTVQNTTHGRASASGKILQDESIFREFASGTRCAKPPLTMTKQQMTILTSMILANCGNVEVDASRTVEHGSGGAGGSLDSGGSQNAGGRAQACEGEPEDCGCSGNLLPKQECVAGQWTCPDNLTPTSQCPAKECCQQDADCGDLPNYECISGICLMRPGDGNSCWSASDCPEGWVCQNSIVCPCDGDWAGPGDCTENIPGGCTDAA